MWMRKLGPLARWDTCARAGWDTRGHTRHHLADLSTSVVCAMAIAAKLASLGIALPAVATPAANYVPFVRSGNNVFISGQIPMVDGAIPDAHKGRVGEGISVDQAKAIARVCGVNMIAALNAACDGNLDRVTRVVKLGGFVQCTSDFTK